MTAYETLALAACKAVAALLPGTDVTDDGGGPYIYQTGDHAEPVELFVLRPEDAAEPADAWHWHYQHNAAEQTVKTSELMLTDEPEDVAAWARTVMPEPMPEAPPVAPLAQLRTAHPDVWEAVYSTNVMTLRQALSAALLGHVDLARQIVTAGPDAWSVMDWPRLT